MLKKLLLMYPNQRWQKKDNTTWNLNIATLCTLAKMLEGLVDIKIYDAQFYNHSQEHFTELLLDYQPDFVGISSLTSEYEHILSISAKTVKEHCPSAIVIGGGIHPTLEFIKVMASEDIDYIVRGEGEYVLRELISYLLGEAPFPEKGIVYREEGTKRIIPQEQVFIEDLTQLPWPNYDLVNIEEYLNTGPRVGPLRAPEFPYMRLMVTRGCPIGCSFCQVEFISGKKVRARDPEDVVNELLYYKEKYGIKSIIFDDDNMMANKKFFYAMLELMIEKELNLKFIIEAFAIFTLTERMLDLLKRAGCIGINVAIESGTERVLKDIVNKPVKLDRVRNQIEKITDAGMFVLANFIIGFPGETWAEIRETIHYAETCGADYVKIFIAMPLRGTKLYDIAVADGLLMTPVDKLKVDWRYGQISSDEWTSKDISILRVYEWDRINFATKEKRKKMEMLWGVNEQELDEIRKETRDSLLF